MKDGDADVRLHAVTTICSLAFDLPQIIGEGVISEVNMRCAGMRYSLLIDNSHIDSLG